ncbi:neuronal pentraxin-1 [Platysternon megacephalum]|uniref:Neuronal pentraxin-1 n=1 Tax=Platysternon megacephalum TaxID=55544 RepID=A0A4D9E8K2_9SAUR|nr:neuronal pentraxin-1 [Platysternon megacephalum]
MEAHLFAFSCPRQLSSIPPWNVHIFPFGATMAGVKNGSSVCVYIHVVNLMRYSLLQFLENTISSIKGRLLSQEKEHINISSKMHVIYICLPIGIVSLDGYG